MLIMLSFLEEAGISNMTSTDSSIWGLGAFVCICVGWWSIVCVSACVFLFVCVCEYLRVWKRENWNWKELWAIYGTSEVLGMPFILRQMVLRYMFSCLVALTLLEVLYLPFTLYPLTSHLQWNYLKDSAAVGERFQKLSWKNKETVKKDGWRTLKSKALCPRERRDPPLHAKTLS